MSLLSRKASLYETEETENNSNMERMTKKFSTDLRNHIRKIKTVTFFTKGK